MIAIPTRYKHIDQLEKKQWNPYNNEFEEIQEIYVPESIEDNVYKPYYTNSINIDKDTLGIEHSKQPTYSFKYEVQKSPHTKPIVDTDSRDGGIQLGDDMSDYVALRKTKYGNGAGGTSSNGATHELSLELVAPNHLEVSVLFFVAERRKYYTMSYEYHAYIIPVLKFRYNNQGRYVKGPIGCKAKGSGDYLYGETLEFKSLVVRREPKSGFITSSYVCDITYQPFNNTNTSQMILIETQAQVVDEGAISKDNQLLEPGIRGVRIKFIHAGTKCYGLLSMAVSTYYFEDIVFIDIAHIRWSVGSTQRGDPAIYYPCKFKTELVSSSAASVATVAVSYGDITFTLKESKAGMQVNLPNVAQFELNGRYVGTKPIQFNGELYLEPPYVNDPEFNKFPASSEEFVDDPGPDVPLHSS